MADAKNLAALVKEAREHDSMLDRALARAVDDALGEVSRQQGGIPPQIAREARGCGLGANMFRDRLRETSRALCDAIEALQRSRAAWEDEAAGAHRDLAAANAEIAALRQQLKDRP